MSKHPSKPPQSVGLNAGALKNYTPYIIAFLSLFAALFYNEWNIHLLRSEAPERLEPIYNWVKTADDISYLRPAENYYKTGVWKDNNPGKQSFFLRTPGYGYFRYMLMKIFGPEQSYFYFKYIQLLLFSISVLLLFYTAILIGLPMTHALIIEAIYGLSPLASGFIYYSITEGITPVLMIGYVFFLFSGYNKLRPSSFLLAALILGYIGITRPILLLFGAALPLAIYRSDLDLSLRNKIVLILLTGIIALAPIGFWALRSAQITGYYIGIYPIYYVENNSQFRPTHQAIWEFEKSYGTDGLSFHQYMVPLWKSTINGDTADTHIDSIMMACPDFVKQTIGAHKLRTSYKLYRQSITYQRSHYAKEVSMPDTIPAIEQEVVRDFQTYTNEINSKHWLWCHVAVPLKLFKSLSLHSDLSLYIFQHTYRGRWWMEGLRILSLILHFFCCISFIGIFLLRGDKLAKVVFGVIIGVYVFYLCYSFRGLEERYTLPILPIMLLGVAYCIQSLFPKIPTPTSDAAD